MSTESRNFSNDNSESQQLSEEECLKTIHAMLSLSAARTNKYIKPFLYNEAIVDYKDTKDIKQFI